MPAKPAECRLAPEAERDMEAIWFYTLEEWGLEQANRYTDELTDAFGQLALTLTKADPVMLKIIDPLDAHLFLRIG
jgi:toxin ParE1/3/4